MFEDYSGFIVQDNGEGVIVLRFLDELVGWLEFLRVGYGFGCGIDINYDI